MLGVEGARVGWRELAQSCKWRPSVQGMVAARILVEEHDRDPLGCSRESRLQG